MPVSVLAPDGCAVGVNSRTAVARIDIDQRKAEGLKNSKETVKISWPSRGHPRRALDLYNFFTLSL